MKRISVIIPGYNTRHEWWVRCVRSAAIAVENAGGGEIICVDDGSRERVDVGVENRCRDGVDLKIIRLEKNCGLPTARNKGLEVATGEFVTFVDSDDEVKPECYLKSLGLLEKYQADVAVFGVKGIYVDDRMSGTDVLPEKFYDALQPEDVRFLYKKRLFYYSCNKVFRRAFFDRYGMRFDPIGVPCEDAIFNVGLVMAKAKWVTVPYVGYVYYRYDGTICSNYKPTYVEGTRACTKRWREYKTTVPNAYEIFGNYDETSEADIVRNQWTNIWRRNSPFTMTQKWDYAAKHKAELGAFTPWVFLKKAVFMILRVHFYIRPIRMWQYRRTWKKIGAHVEKWDGIV